MTETQRCSDIGHTAMKQLTIVVEVRQTANARSQNCTGTAGCFKENEGSVQLPSFDSHPFKENTINRAQYMSSSLSGEKLKVKPPYSSCHSPNPRPPRAVLK